jgi:SAM-dependent methyltransferase
MRKDYAEVEDRAAGQTEERFVEDYWTRVWGNEVPDEQRLRAVRRREEYRAMLPYLRRLPAGSRILDGGCGLGEWTLAFSRDGFDAYGVDLSRQTCERLSALYPKAHFQVGDIRGLAFPDGFFDVYFSWGTFEHFEEGLEPCFREARRVLRPGGMLFASVPFHNRRLMAMDARQPAAAPPAGTRKRRFYQWRLTREEFGARFVNAGFELIDVQPVHKQEGVRRFVCNRFGVRADTAACRAMTWLISPWLKRGFANHMLLGTGRVPGDVCRTS